jgi:hypothetical protein
MPTVTEITAQVLSGRDVVRQGSAFRFLAQPRQPPIAPPDGIAPVLEFVNELKGLCDNYFSSQDKDRITNYEDIAYLAQQIEDGLASPPRQRRSATAKTLIPRGDCWPVENRTVAASGAGSKSRPRPRACRHRGVAPRRAELMQPPGARAQTRSPTARSACGGPAIGITTTSPPARASSRASRTRRRTGRCATSRDSERWSRSRSSCGGSRSTR